jgi:Dolichyl-phosphate-mannose-protein mannosyltransferase
MAATVHEGKAAVERADAGVSRSAALTSNTVLFRGAAAALLLLMAVLAGGAAWRESVAIDEIAHIGAGVSYLQRFDLRMNPEHPPLAKMIAALPLAARGVRADYSSYEWTASRDVLVQTMGDWSFGDHVVLVWNNPRSVLAWARGAMLLLTLALGFVVCVFAKRIGGNLGGLLCLTVFVSAPTFLTFGPMVLTDVPVALFCLLALWAFAEMWREPSKANVRLFGVSLAGALLSKFSAGILFFAFGAFILSSRFWPMAGQPAEKARRKAWRRARWRAMWRGIFLAACVVYLFYLIFSWNQPTQYMIPTKGPEDFPRLLGNALIARAIRRLLLPVWIYLLGVLAVLITSSRTTFILGHGYTHGVWFYYPVIFGLKSPLGFLGLLALTLSVGLACRRRKRISGSASAIPENLHAQWRVLWVSLVVFTAICMLVRLSISIRHFTLPIVLAILLVAPLPRMLSALRESGSRPARAWQALAALLAASCLWTAVRAYPYYMPYASALGFGKPAYRLMSDSNVDWGQELPEVRKFAEARGLTKIDADVYALVDPNTSVPEAQFWNCQRPTASDAGLWAAVSANMILDGHNCRWLLQYPHQKIAGGGIYMFHLPEQIPAAGTPGGPPLPSQYREFAGFPIDMRLTFIEVGEHPEHMPQIMAKFRAMFTEEMAKRKRARSKK